ncbi:hypothetical protein L3Q82_008074 [Scortum barcoo]|uniref:Uncharacterized protein n=1 Tax=Scortum barcoo TaxID=214431 RepID=A0ACB8WKV2_9TELE|nr:hypothetical protein L3Q82_008074 [Scortum barcoo]
MASDSFQYRALFEYKRERGDDISLQPGDLLTVSKASLTVAAGRRGWSTRTGTSKRSPKGWLHGTNERTKEKGDFPGTFVEYVGVVRVGPPAAKSWPRPVPPTPGGAQAAAQPPGATAAAVLLFVEEVRFIDPVLKVNYGGPPGACVKLMTRVKLLSRSAKGEGDTNKLGQRTMNKTGAEHPGRPAKMWHFNSLKLLSGDPRSRSERPGCCLKFWEFICERSGLHSGERAVVDSDLSNAEDALHRDTSSVLVELLTGCTMAKNCWWLLHVFRFFSSSMKRKPDSIIISQFTSWLNGDLQYARIQPSLGETKNTTLISCCQEAHGVEAELLSEAAPVVIWRLIEALEKHGLSSESLYRAPPASGGPAELRQALDSDKLGLTAPARVRLLSLNAAEVQKKLGKFELLKFRFGTTRECSLTPYFILGSRRRAHKI